jgi:hypothetical protein
MVSDPSGQRTIWAAVRFALTEPSEDGLDDVGGGGVELERDARDVCIRTRGVCAADGERSVWGFDQSR